ncbi:ras-related protein Rab-21 [Orussus abietinus]|uniref:ras-related protein Rab-21 n=1 Tax=Orussus abietinus TaxID=222816 RepID=UPI00062501FE|nr:ras-related protein Rab-21 [Orussus abietinus]XP_012279359.1 ras-related protein Rab-21 [Orussus abietinus]
MATSSSSTSNSYDFKVVLLGEGSVGKTSVILRYVEDKFNDKHTFTTQASYLDKKLNINGKRINLAIWDTAGQEKFHALGPIYYRMSNGAVLVYDITEKYTFKKVKDWVKELRKMLGYDVCLAIAGNKIDLEKNRNVSIEEAEEYAKQVGAMHFHTSAKLNQNIEEMFLDLTQRMMEKADEAERTATLTRTNSTRRNVVIVEDESEQQQPPTKSSCCGGSTQVP